MQISSHTCKLAFVGALLVSAFAAQPSGAATAPTTTCQAPPGTSAIDQYCEALPSPGGTGNSRHHHRKGSQAVSNSTKRQLEQQGPAGKAVLNLANSSGAASAQGLAPSAAAKHLAALKKHHKHKSGGSSGPPAATNSAAGSQALPAPDSNPLSAVGSAIGTGSSTGAVFLGLLVALALVMGGTAFIGYRRRAQEG